MSRALLCITGRHCQGSGRAEEDLVTLIVGILRTADGQPPLEQV